MALYLYFSISLFLYFSISLSLLAPPSTALPATRLMMVTNLSRIPMNRQVRQRKVTQKPNLASPCVIYAAAISVKTAPWHPKISHRIHSTSAGENLFYKSSISIESSGQNVEHYFFNKVLFGIFLKNKKTIFVFPKFIFKIITKLNDEA